MNTNRRKHIAILFICLIVVALVAVACGKKAEAPTKYHCPMHPTYISDRPGDCPICGMRLVPIETKEAPAAKANYVCPMHPEVTSDQPGVCPKCGMALVPTEKTTAPAAGAPSGMSDVSVSVEGVRLAGVITEPAILGSLARSVRTVGLVTPDETRIRHMHTKISGWIEHLNVSFTGQIVRKGEPILTIYSPELVAGQEEFLRALQAVELFSKSDLPELRRGSEDLLTAARRRLELYDVPHDFVTNLERTGVPQRTVTLLSHASGYVTAKDVFEGMQVEPGMELFTITDLSRVWVEADFYEYEALAVKVGQIATLTLPFDPSLKLEGRVVYILPYISPESRTLKVRLEFPNREITLKPSMYANVELRVETGDGIVVPDSAIMDTGERQMVFVQRQDGVFEPREVKVGIRSAGKAIVLSGVSEGERVAIRANFLLDSESRLRAAIEGKTAAPAASEHAGHGGMQR